MSTPYQRVRRIAIVLLMMMSGGFSFSCDARPAPGIGPGVVRHDLRIRILPEAKTLSGTDAITLPRTDGREIPFLLSDKIRVQRIEVGGSPADFRHRSGRLTVLPETGSGGGEITVTVHYEGRFDDPAPDMPVNTDNPGYGVTGTISETGVFLLGGAAWYPVDAGPATAIRLSVEAPSGMVAVTAGKSLGIQTRDGLTRSTWEIARTPEPIALSAGPYEVREKAVGGIIAATYLFPESRHLSDGYLDAVARFIRLYEELFGPYPFEKFAVVENFFPTGYGFPSYTLLGTQVLHLPFIRETSLGHEIAHCWWGNGVGVDASRGNWSEGLTTYVSDYLYQERRSPEAGREYRRQILRNYADIIRPGTEPPLSAFLGRTDPATKVVGYDKGAMVFHMLRREVGDDAFREALRTLYRTYLFQAVSWTEIQTVFERVHGSSLGVFFDPWLNRPGALELSLENMTTVERAGRALVTGTLRQSSPGYHARVPVALFTPDGETRTLVTLTGERADFRLEIPPAPETRREGPVSGTVIVDPDADLFRRLYPEEIPPSINSLRGSQGTVVVVPENRPKDSARARLLIEALGLDPAEVVTERGLTDEILRNRDLIFMAMPRDRSLLRGMPASAAPDGRSVSIGSRTVTLEEHSLFLVFGHPASTDRVAALFLSPEGPAEAVLRKVPHYGKYSYLVFQDGTNRDKGVWPISESPLIHRFQIETRSHRRQP